MNMSDTMTTTMERNRHARKRLSFRIVSSWALVSCCTLGVVVVLMLQIQTTTNASSWLRSSAFCNDAYKNITNIRAATKSSQNQEEELDLRKSFVITTARDIVHLSYQKSFAVLQSNCPLDRPLMECLKDIQETSKHADVSYPWWFRTLIRDVIQGGGDGMFRPWQICSNANPQLEMCTIGKVGTTQWRKVFCQLDASCNHPSLCPSQDQQSRNQTSTNNSNLSSSTNKTKERRRRMVFVRDPLERFLSAFLDKCVRHRQDQLHCQPSFVFQKDRNVGRDVLADPKLFFQVYVDAMPLMWDMHFVPMGLHCNGLYRDISNYDFVGIMGSDFYQHVETVGEEFGILPQVTDVFRLNEQRLANSTNVGVETQAASHVHEYYTVETVKRVLEYLSLDYVSLSLPIPEWVDEMIRKEQEEMRQQR